MRIGIDARMLGPHVGGGGLGRYVEQLVAELHSINDENRFVLFLKQENFEDVPDGFEKRLTNIHWYTLKEQRSLAKYIDREHLDLVHFPHWNVPMNLKTPFMVTIHDLILLEQPKSAKATTRNPFMYAIKYWSYKRVLKHAIMNARHIIAVSEYTKQSILKHFPKVDANKITVIYEGLTLLREIEPAQMSLPASYILYVGNSYPHKNLETLIRAFDQLEDKHIQLVLAGRHDVFREKLKAFAATMERSDQVRFISNPTDNELATLYQHAALYVFPSLSEGFGLPPLEAMQFNTPVISSNATALPEILGNAALYIDPTDSEALAKQIDEVLTNNELQQTMINRGHEQIKRYSWSTMAKHIHTLYKSLCP